MTSTLSPPRARTRRRLRRTPRWWRDAVGVACWGSALIVVALWLSGRGAQLLVEGPADLFTSLGRITGLVAADLLLVQVFLMARVPMIERSYGQDELARRHRLVGFASFNLLMLHVLLILIGYTLRDHNDLVHETWSVVTSYGGMLLAAAAVAALTAVVVTSVRVARRKLRYESWHLLHLYAYLGVGLSVPHEIWTGADFATSPLARVYWWSAYAAALVAVVIYRLGVPLWRSLRHGITVSSVVRESPDVVSVHLTGRGLHRLPARAGQYFVFRFLDGEGWSRGNPYSLSATPSPRRLRVTAKDAGDGSRRLAWLRPGTKVLIEGPYGRLTGEHRVTTKVAMLACGIGITPLRSLLEDLEYAAGDAVLIYRAHAVEDLVFRSELDELASRRGIAVHYVLGPRIRTRASWLPQSAADWSDADALLSLVPDLAEYDVFVCGPDQWMDAACAAAVAAGLPAEQLHQERFSW
ncbi:ferric reductase-like transmembrane domain-containing protein [Kribbella sp. NPDC020789]